MRKILLTTFTLIALAACSKQDNSPPPAPQQISDSAVGHYCSMNLTEHNGPKAQIFLNGKPDKPVWFSTIKQMFGYTKLPEEPKGIHAIYVTDMGKVKDWEKPNADTEWIDAKKAYYVIEAALSAAWVRKMRFRLPTRLRLKNSPKKKAAESVGFAEMPDEYIFNKTINKRPSETVSDGLCVEGLPIDI